MYSFIINNKNSGHVQTFVGYVSHIGLHWLVGTTRAGWDAVASWRSADVAWQGTTSSWEQEPLIPLSIYVLVCWYKEGNKLALAPRK